MKLKPGRKKDVPAPESLIGSKTYLRPATPDDIQNTYHWTILSEPQSLTSHPRLTLTAAQAAERFKGKAPSFDEQTFMVVRQVDKVPVGRISFFNYNHLNRSAETGVIIDPDERRNGYASDAIWTLCRFLFLYRGLNKVTFQTVETNEGMIKIAEGLGFQREGDLRQEYFLDGEWLDGRRYSLLRFEFDARG